MLLSVSTTDLQASFDVTPEAKVFSLSVPINENKSKHLSTDQTFSPPGGILFQLTNFFSKTVHDVFWDPLNRIKILPQEFHSRHSPPEKDGLINDLCMGKSNK